jgi:DNA-binding transcriptional regulator YiaG
VSPVAGAPWTPPEVIHGAPESVRALNHTAGITPLESQREAAGISQRELARRTGISQATLSRIEAGQEPRRAKRS